MLARILIDFNVYRYSIILILDNDEYNLIDCDIRIERFYLSLKYLLVLSYV